MMRSDLDFERPYLAETARRHWRLGAPKRYLAGAFALGFLLCTALITGPVQAATAADLDRDAVQALKTLSKTNHLAADMAEKAVAILVFPNIVKAGLIFGGAYGEGVLLKKGTVVDYYNSVSGSWGFQAGAESFSYVVFLMTKDALDYVSETAGWELGIGPSIVVVDEGAAKNLSSSSLQDDAYAFIFSQQGLMASLSIEGTKISKIKR